MRQMPAIELQMQRQQYLELGKHSRRHQYHQHKYRQGYVLHRPSLLIKLGDQPGRVDVYGNKIKKRSNAGGPETIPWILPFLKRIQQQENIKDDPYSYLQAGDLTGQDGVGMRHGFKIHKVKQTGL